MVTVYGMRTATPAKTARYLRTLFSQSEVWWTAEDVHVNVESSDGPLASNQRTSEVNA